MREPVCSPGEKSTLSNAEGCFTPGVGVALTILEVGVFSLCPQLMGGPYSPGQRRWSLGPGF